MKTIRLVPGNDWAAIPITVKDEAGAAIDLSSLTIERKRISHAKGSIELDVDTSDAGDGVWKISAGRAVTAALPIGAGGSLEIRAIDTAGTLKTYVFLQAVGVHSDGDVSAAASYPGVQGPRGRSVHPVDSTAELVDGFGNDGDTAIIVTTGAEWRKTAGVWAATGRNFWGTLLAQGADHVELARRWAEEAPGVAVDGGFSAFHWATAAEYWATRPELSTVAENIEAVQVAAENMDAIIVAPQAAADAATYRDQTLGYKDEGAVSAQTAADMAASASDTYDAMVAELASVTNYDNTLAQLRGAQKRALVAADVVRSIGYDTRRDSDAGRWRYFRVRGLSWWGETLGTGMRGARRDFPKLAQIIGQPATLTVLDGDDVALPLWKSWTVAGLTSIAALGGLIVYTGTGGVYIIDMIRDEVLRYSTAGMARANQKVATYNQGTATWTVIDAAKAIVNDATKELAIAVIDGTPLDTVRKLPTPTVDVLTDGGITRIRYDGSTANTTGYTTAPTRMARVDGGLLTQARYNNWPCFIRDAELSAGSNVSGSTYFMNAGAITGFCETDRTLEVAGPVGLYSFGKSQLLRHSLGDTSVSAANMRVLRSTTVNTGWMVGNIRMALAESSADLTSLVGATPLSDDFSSYADTAAMGAVWSLIAIGAGSTPTLDAARLSLVTNNGSDYGRANRSFPTVAGVRYTVAADISNNWGQLWVGTAANGNNLANSGSIAPGTRGRVSFVASGATTWLALNTFGIPGTTYFDNVSVELVANDRSVAANHPRVVGTVTRSAVATGAELAAYGGFSASNYLEVSYSSALDFGTGDFCLMAWVNFASATADGGEIFGRRSSGNTGAGFRFYRNNGSDTFTFHTFDAANAETNAIATGVSPVGRYGLVIALRRAGTLEIWVNGVRVANATGTIRDVSNITAILRMGATGSASLPMTGSFLCLPRVTYSAPTPAQIRAIYEDERKLFEPNAKCLLAGSGTINLPGYDRGTGILYIPQTTGGTDLFRGLVRVGTMNIASEGSAMTSNNHKAVNAENDNIAIVTAAETYIKTASIGLREAMTGRDVMAPYDRNKVLAPSAYVTINATPSVIGFLPMDKGEAGEWFIRVAAREYGEPTTPELASYEVRVTVARPQEGNIAVLGSPAYTVVSEVTSTMDLTVAANTTVQALALTATGVGAKNVEWGYEARFVPATQQVAA